MASIDGFLTTYFKQLHFNSMSPEVRARWEEYMKLPDLNWSMKDWRRELMHETAPDSGEYVNFDLPSIKEGENTARVDAGLKDPGLTDDQIKDLYKYMNAAVSGMAEDKKINNAEFKTAKDFVNDFYGTFEVGEPPVSHTNIFNIIKVSSPTKTTLEDIIRLPNGALHILKAPVERALEQISGEKKLTFDKLIEKIQKGDYDKDSAFREQLIKLFENIENFAPYSWLDYTPDGGATYPNKTNLYQFTGTLRDSLVEGLKPEPSDDVIERFKRGYGNVFERIYKKPKVKALFAEHDNNGIIAALDAARNAVNYDVPDQPNYLYPKTEKHLNAPQRIKKAIDDFYENNLEKYFNNLGGDRLFKSKPARDIVKGINKAKIKRTGGLDEILTNSDKIKKEIEHESTSTGSHFEWFLKEMKVIKDADDKAFEACLRNGVSLRGVVQRVIMDAVSAGKVAEAKTALEILSVMKYENTTSKTLDAIKEDKDLFKYFSNLELAKKNEGTKFVAEAMDKTMRIGGIAIATMATVAVNTVRKLGSKIHKENKDLNAAHNAKKAENERDKTELQNKIEDNRRNEAQKQREKEAVISRYGDEDTINNKLNEKKTYKDRLTSYLKTELDNMEAFKNRTGATDDEVNAYDTFVQWYEKYMNDGTAIPDAVYDAMPDTMKVYTDKIKRLLRAYPAVNDHLTQAQETKKIFDEASNALTVASDELAANQKKLDSWDTDHKDKYDELIKYWNELEFGRDMHLGRVFGGMYSRFGNKKTQQEQYFAKFNNGIPSR